MNQHCNECLHKLRCENEQTCLLKFDAKAHKEAHHRVNATANPTELKIAVLEGEMELHHDEIGWWAAELDFWRRKYLKDHPEHDNWDYVANARKREEG